jgi:hypothetical protein
MTDYIARILQMEGPNSNIKSFIGLKQFPASCKSDADYMAYLIKRLLVLKFEQHKITLSSPAPPPNYPFLKSRGYNSLITPADIASEKLRRQHQLQTLRTQLDSRVNPTASRTRSRESQTPRQPSRTERQEIRDQQSRLDDDIIRRDLLSERVHRIKTHSILDLPLTDIFLGLEGLSIPPVLTFGPENVRMPASIYWDIMFRETQDLRHIINLWTARITQYKFIREIAGREPAFAVAEAERLQLNLNDIVSGPYPDSPLIYPNSWGTPENFEKGLEQLENEKEILVTRRNNLLILLYAIGYHPSLGSNYDMEIQEKRNLTRNNDHIMSVGEFIDKITTIYHSYIINRQIFKKILFSMLPPEVVTKFPERDIQWEIFQHRFGNNLYPGMPGIIPIIRGQPGGPLDPAPVVGELQYYEEMRRIGRIDRSPVPLPEPWRLAAERSIVYRIIEDDPLIGSHTPTYSIRNFGGFGSFQSRLEAPLAPFDPFSQYNYIIPTVGTPLEEAAGAARQYEFPTERIFRTEPAELERIPPHPGSPPPSEPVETVPNAFIFGSGPTRRLPRWYTDQLDAHNLAIGRAHDRRVYHPTRVQYSEDEPVTLDRIWAILNEIDASFNGTHFLRGMQGTPTNSFPTRFRLTRYKEILSLIEKFGRLKTIGTTSRANYDLEQKSSDFTSTPGRRSKRRSPRRKRQSPRRKPHSPLRRSPRRKPHSPRRSKRRSTRRRSKR